MKLARLLDERFQKQLKRLMASKLPIKTVYKLRTIVRNIDAAIADYDSVRETAMKKYGRKKDDGGLLLDANGGVQFDKESMAAFFKEMNELASLNVEIAQLSIDDLGDNIEVTVDDLISLDDLIQ